MLYIKWPFLSLKIYDIFLKKQLVSVQMYFLYCEFNFLVIFFTKIV